MLLLAIAATSVCLAVAIIVYLLATARSEPTGVARSLAIVERRIDRHEVARNELGAKDRLIIPILHRTRNLGVRLSPSDAGQRLARLLDQAGNPSGWTPENLLGAKGAGLLVGILFRLLIGGFSLRGLFWMIGLGRGSSSSPTSSSTTWDCVAGRLRRGLADALDMLTVCVEAGQGFNAALMQVARSVTGPVAGEFARVLSEVQIGRSRADAFAAMGSAPESPRSGPSSVPSSSGPARPADRQRSP